MKININVEVELNMDNMETSLTIDDIKNQLAFYSDDTVDGFVLTRNSSDNTEVFYISSAKITKR